MENAIEVLNALTIEEKAALLEGVDSWETNAIPRFKIRRLFMTDGPHGLRKVRHENGGFAVSDNEHSTAFPTSASVACGWNTDNAYQIGVAIAKECLASGVNVLLAPGVNIKRSPLCGRNFEYFSEDPMLTGDLGSAFVRGVQSMGVGCCVKHFAVNSNEDFRFYGNSAVDERAFREIYLRAFERIVKDTKPCSIMASYNQINGTFASQNKVLLTEILRNEWGFDGVVMTDWGGTVDRVQDLLAGCDLDMPGNVYHNRKTMIEGVKDGSVPVEALNCAVLRMLKLIKTYGIEQKATGFDAKMHARLPKTALENNQVIPQDFHRRGR